MKRHAQRRHPQWKTVAPPDSDTGVAVDWLGGIAVNWIPIRFYVEPELIAWPVVTRCASVCDDGALLLGVQHVVEW